MIETYNKQYHSYHYWSDFYRGKTDLGTTAAKFQKISPTVRFDKLVKISGTYLGRFLLIDSDPDGRLFHGFSDSQTAALWEKFLKGNNNKRELFVGTRGLKASSPKVLALLDALLKLKEEDFYEYPPRTEFVAKLAAFFKWGNLTAEQQAHPLFAGILRSTIPQQLAKPSRALCERAERHLSYQIDSKRVVLVNDHLLAKRDEIPALLCLRTFISADGAVFLKGNSYAPVDEPHYSRVKKLFPGYDELPWEAQTLNNLTLSPNRYFSDCYYPYYDLEEIASQFPPIKA